MTLPPVPLLVVFLLIRASVAPLQRHDLLAQGLALSDELLPRRPQLRDSLVRRGRDALLRPLVDSFLGLEAGAVPGPRDGYEGGEGGEEEGAGLVVLLAVVFATARGGGWSRGGGCAGRGWSRWLLCGLGIWTV